MAIEYNHQGWLGKIKGVVARNPDLYLRLKLGRDRLLRAVGFYPVICHRNVAGIHYKMSFASRQEENMVQGAAYEAGLIETMVNIIRPGDVVYDVGASTGTHAIPSAIKAGPQGKVYAFEPDDECAEILQGNLDLNGVSNVGIRREALWDRDTTLTLHTSGVSGEAPQVSPEGMAVSKAFLYTTQIPARSIRSLINEGLDIPDILKIDVEGAGEQVLQGLGQYRPRAIFFEVHPTMGENPSNVRELLKNWRYDLIAESDRGEQKHLVFVRQ